MLPLLAGAALAGGSSFLSGLLGRSSAKKQAAREEAAIRKANDVATAQASQMNKEMRARADAAALVPVATSSEHAERSMSHRSGGVDMGAFMAAAKDYGFNPLTFLRSGALSLFSTETSMSATDTMDWTCTTGERAMEAATQGNYLPQLQPVIAQTRVPGMGDVLGNALQSGANQYLTGLSQSENNDFQMRLLNAKLSGANERASGAPSMSRSFYQPQAFLGGSVSRGSPGPTSEIKPLMVEYFDNRTGSPTYGKTIQFPDSDLSPEAIAALGLIDTGVQDPYRAFRAEPWGGGAKIVPGSPADRAVQAFSSAWDWFAGPADGVVVRSRTGQPMSYGGSARSRTGQPM